MSVLPPLVPPGPDLTAEELQRYSRHVILPGLGREGQRRLKNARVLVVGAGGLGSPALMYLAAAGVGALGVLDDDVVEVSNLQRQVIHGQSDLGRPKVASARERIGEVNPLIDVRVHQVHLDADNALEILAGYDLVLDGTDTFATRYLVADACEILGVPVVWGSIFRFDGQVSVFWPGRGPTYRDVFPTPPPAGSVPSCAEGGVLGAMCAAIGSVMATEAIKLICGLGRPLVGRMLVLDALDMSWRTVGVQPDPHRAPVTALPDDAAACETAPAGTIDVRQLAGMLEARRRGEFEFVLVDVREPGERDVVTIPGSVPIPQAELLSGAALRSLPAGVPVVLHCKSGGRSAQALAALQAAGRTDATHVAGGVLAWVREIDPSLPTY